MKRELMRLVSGGMGGHVYSQELAKVINGMTEREAECFVRVIQNHEAEGKRDGERSGRNKFMRTGGF